MILNKFRFDAASLFTQSTRCLIPPPSTASFNHSTLKITTYPAPPPHPTPNQKRAKMFSYGFSTLNISCVNHLFKHTAQQCPIPKVSPELSTAWIYAMAVASTSDTLGSVDRTVSCMVTPDVSSASLARTSASWPPR